MLEGYGIHTLIWDSADERLGDWLIASPADAAEAATAAATAANSAAGAANQVATQIQQAAQRGVFDGADGAYSAVQQRVNEILGAAGTSSTSIDVDAMARAVIRGDYGNGEERRQRLGSYYSIDQARVNEMLS